MSLNKLKLSKKAAYVMQDPARVIFTEGTTRTGKSYILGIKFFKKVFVSPEDHTNFFLCAASVPTITQRFVNDLNSFYQLFKVFCEFKRDDIGGGPRMIKTYLFRRLFY